MHVTITQQYCCTATTVNARSRTLPEHNASGSVATFDSTEHSASGSFATFDSTEHSASSSVATFDSTWADWYKSHYTREMEVSKEINRVFTCVDCAQMVTQTVSVTHCSELHLLSSAEPCCRGLSQGWGRGSQTAQSVCAYSTRKYKNFTQP